MPGALIIGTGMLGTALLRAADSHGLTAQALSHSQLDISQPDQVAAAIQSLRPDLIFHCAALTKVSQCQREPQLAQQVNAQGTASVVEAAERAMARLIYFSTDYVFDGRKGAPYVETDTPAPLNAYGASKLAGEQAVRAYHRGHVIRTSGVFGPRADGVAERNFFRAILEQLGHGADVVPVVTGQRTAVTYAPHLASMVLSLRGETLPALCHLTSAGSDSWFDWARRLASAAGLDAQRITPLDIGA